MAHSLEIGPFSYSNPAIVPGFWFLCLENPFVVSRATDSKTIQLAMRMAGSYVFWPRLAMNLRCVGMTMLVQWCCC